MGQLKVRFRFYPGRHGAPMDKLGEFTEQAEKFLRSLANDLGIDAKKGIWLANNFGDGSFECDGEYGGAIVDDAILDRGIEALDTVFSEHPLEAANKNLVTNFTLVEFAKIGEVLSPGEFFLAGVYPKDERAEVQVAPLKEIPHKRTAEIKQLLSTPFVTMGALQGVFHAWHPGAEEPFFNVRAMQMSSRQLVKCFYEPDIYDEVRAATVVKDSVVIVYGETRWDRIANAIQHIKVSSVETKSRLSESEFNRLFGSAPEFTGTMTTEEYIDWVRGDGEQS